MTTEQTEVTTEKPAVDANTLGDLADKEPVEETPEESTEEVEAPEVESEEESEEEVEEEKPEGEEEVSEEEPKPKKKGGFQKRIDRLNKQKADESSARTAAEKERDYWREQALRGQKPPEEKIVELAKDLSKRPVADNFETNDQYLEALVDWKADQKVAAQKEAEQKKRFQTEAQTRLNTYKARAIAFAKTQDDFDEALNSVPTPMSVAVNEAILDSEYGPQMAYALANDLEEYERICNLPYSAGLRAMGKLEAKFATGKTETKISSDTKIPKAPKPVTPVRNRGTSATKDINNPAIEQREYEKLREEQTKLKNRR